MPDVLDINVIPDIGVTPLSAACGAEISGVDLSKPLSNMRSRRSRKHGPSISCWCFAASRCRRTTSCALPRILAIRQPQEGAGAVARPRRGGPAGSREGAPGHQHQGRRPADRGVRRRRVLVPHRFRLFGAALQVHLPLCAGTAVVRRQHPVRQYVQGLRRRAGRPQAKLAGKKACTSTNTIAPSRPVRPATSAASQQYGFMYVFSPS